MPLARSLPKDGVNVSTGLQSVSGLTGEDLLPASGIWLLSSLTQILTGLLTGDINFSPKGQLSFSRVRISKKEKEQERVLKSEATFFL